MFLSISFEHFIVEKFIHWNKWSSLEKEYRRWQKCNSRNEEDTPVDDASQSELIVENEIKKSTQVKKTRITNVPENIKTEVGTCALIQGTKAALERFIKIYPKYTFLRTSISNWKFKIKKDKEGKTMFKWKGRPNVLSDDLMAKVMIHNLQLWLEHALPELLLAAVL